MDARFERDQREPETLPEIMWQARAGDWTDMATHRIAILIRAARNVEEELARLQRQCGEISTENASQQAALCEIARMFSDFADKLPPLLEAKLGWMGTGLENYTAKMITDVNAAHAKNLKEQESGRKVQEAMRMDIFNAFEKLMQKEAELVAKELKVGADAVEVESDRKVLNRRKAEFERRVEAFSKMPLWQRIFPPKAAERRAARDEG